MKTSDIILTANKNLLKNKIRSFLTILAIFVGSFTIILNSAISAGVNDYVDNQISAMGGDGYIEMMPAAMTDMMSAMMSSELKEYTDEKDRTNTSVSFSDEQIEKVENAEGMKRVIPIYMTSVDYITSDYTDKRYIASLNLAIEDESFHYDMVAGEIPKTDENSKYEIALNENYIKPLGFKSAEDAIGKEVKLGVPATIKCYTSVSRKDCQTIVTATITGVQSNGILSMGGPRMSLNLWNKVHEINTEGMPEESADTVYEMIAFADPEKVDSIKDYLKENGIIAMTIDDEVGTIRVFFDAILAILNIFGGIALVAAAIGIINTLFMAVQERTREIGLMKALGMSRAKIFLSFSIEAISLGFWGSLFGTAVSMVIGNVANMILHGEGMFLETFPTFNLVKFTPSVIVPIIILVMVIAFIAGTAPALKAAKKDPIDALRYE